MVSKAILKSAKIGDKLALENLVNKNIKYIYWVAHKYCLQGISCISFEDLVSEGKLGLFKALKNYDIENSSEFLAYAYPYIKKEMLNYINNNIFYVHMSDSQIRKYNSTKRSQNNKFKNFKFQNVISIDNSTNAFNLCIENSETKVNDDIFWYDLQFYGLSSTEIFVIKKFYVEGFQLKEIEKMLSMEKKMVTKIKNRALTKLKEIFNQGAEKDSCRYTAEGGD